MLHVSFSMHRLICCSNFDQTRKACQVLSLSALFVPPFPPWMTRTRAPAPPSLGLLGSLLQQPSPLFTARPVPSLSLHARPASALARLGPPRPWLGSARLGSARPLASHSLSLHPTRTTWHGPPCLLTTCSLTHVCVATRLCCPCSTRFASRSALPSTPCLPQHSAVIPTRLWPACIPHRAVTRPVEVGRAWPGPLSARCLHTLVQMCLCAACTLVQHSGPHSGPPYRPGPTRPGTQARPLTHVYVCSLMCAFAQTMFSHCGLR